MLKASREKLTECLPVEAVTIDFIQQKLFGALKKNILLLWIVAKKGPSCNWLFSTGTAFFQRPEHLWAISTNDNLNRSTWHCWDLQISKMGPVSVETCITWCLNRNFRNSQCFNVDVLLTVVTWYLKLAHQLSLMGLSSVQSIHGEGRMTSFDSQLVDQFTLDECDIAATGSLATFSQLKQITWRMRKELQCIQGGMRSVKTVGKRGFKH